jgi:hypothetical protein
VELIGDRSAFDWIAQNLDREGFAVSRLLPPVFAAYCKILHPIHVDLSVADRSLSWDEAASATTWVDRISAPDLTKDIVRDLVSGGTLVRGVPDEAFPRARVLWRELAAQYAVNYTPQITDEAFTQIFPGRSWPRYLVGPNEGTLDEESCRRLIEILALFTGTQMCFFYYNLIATRSIEALLYSGGLDEVLSTFQIERAHGTPSYWWPEDRTWCVCTDWDLTYTIVGGSSDLAWAIDGDAILESVRLSRESTYGGPP